MPKGLNFYFKITIPIILIFNSSCKTETTDADTTPDKIKYESVIIGNQVWMKKNLDVITYRNGDTIPQVAHTKQWGDLTLGAWCYYDNDPANGAIYGRLYNWYAVNDPRGLAPSGWHIPSNGEWTELIEFLGNKYSVGGALKEIGNSHWLPPNIGATNSSGFTALPGGFRDTDGEFLNIGEFGGWWTSTQEWTRTAWSWDLRNSEVYANDYASYTEKGFSIRCIKDTVK